jgi:uncharacterized protein (TIGR02145 family)
LKDSSISDWCNNSPCGESGFNALPSGYRAGAGGYLLFGTGIYFWSCSRPYFEEEPDQGVYVRYLSNSRSDFPSSSVTYPEHSLRVRCVKE